MLRHGYVSASEHCIKYLTKDETFAYTVYLYVLFCFYHFTVDYLATSNTT